MITFWSFGEVQRVVFEIILTQTNMASIAIYEYWFPSVVTTHAIKTHRSRFMPTQLPLGLRISMGIRNPRREDDKVITTKRKPTMAKIQIFFIRDFHATIEIGALVWSDIRCVIWGISQDYID